MFENYKFLKKNIFVFFIIYSLFVTTNNALNVDKVANFINKNIITSPIIKGITNTITLLKKQDNDDKNNKLINEDMLLLHFSKQSPHQLPVQFQNEYINILNVVNTESLENYLIYWRYDDYKKQLDYNNNWLNFLYKHAKTLIWVNAIIKPMVLVFLWFPNIYGFGFYSGQTSEDICASLTAIPATYWSNIYFKPLCYELIAKKFDTFYYTTTITIYFLFLIWSLKKILKFVIKKFF